MSDILDPRSILIVLLIVGLIAGGLALAQNTEYMAAITQALDAGRATAYDAAITSEMVVYTIPENVEAPPVDLPQLKEHAIERHGALATLVDTCLRANGREAQFLNPDTGRWYLPCKLPSGKYGIGIYELVERAGQGVWENVTAYPTRYATLTAVWKYLAGGNVIRIEP